MTSLLELCPASFYALPGGGRIRYALFDPPQTPRGTILMAPGRREFIEKKYAETGKEFLARGFRLIIFEWRGQGLSDRFLSGAMRQRDHVDDFSTYIGDLNGFYDDVVRQNLAGPLYIHGHSMGAHLLLRWAGERKDTAIRAGVFTAPMLALGPRFAHGAALGISRMTVALGRGEHYGPGQHDYGVHERSFAGNPLTGDAARFAIMQNYFDAFPDMTVGGVTWAWLYAALRSMREMRNAAAMERVTIPVLSLTGNLDRVTPAHELARYLMLSPSAETVIISGARHDVMNETDTLRAEAWQHIDHFLARAAAR